MRNLFFFFLILLCSQLYAGNGHFVNYDAADGLCSNAVYAITQDNEGLLWIGTRGGLNRFDGSRFQSWKEELPSAHVTSLVTDRQNRLWAGTTGGLCVYENGTFTMGPSGHIRALCADSDGYVWAATIDNLLYRLSFEAEEGVVTHSCVRYSMDHFEGDYPYQQIFEEPGGRLWLGGRIVHCQYIDEREDPVVRFRFDDHYPMGSYAYTDSTLYAYSDFTSMLLIFRGTETIELGQVPIAHASLLADREGRLWAAGSYGLGLVDRDDPRQTIVYRHVAEDPGSLSSTELYCIYEDRQGNLWVGGEGGLSVLCPELQHVKKVEGLGSAQITDLMQGSDRRLWVGTADNGAYAVDMSSGAVEHIDYRPAGRVNEGHVSCLYEDSEGRVYIGLWAGCGFNIVEKGKVRRGAVSGPVPLPQHKVADGDRITSNWIADFLEDSSGRFWVVTWEGVGLNEWDRISGQTLPAQWLSPFKYPTPQEDSCIYISSRLGSRLIEDHKGNLVYGTTEAGLNLIDPVSGLVTKYLHSNTDTLSIPHDYVTDLCLTPDGTLWVATHGGLWSPSGRRLLNGIMVQSLESDGNGRLWAGTEEGLHFIDTDGSQGVAEKGIGLLSDIYSEHTSCLLEDGSLAFGGQSGAMIFHPDSLLAAGRPKLFLPLCSLEGNDLSFSFSPTSLPLSPLLKYRYMLEGEDQEWVYADYPDMQTRYNNLMPGHYTLRIECTDFWGRWSADTFTMPVKVQAPLLLRWPFLLLYIIVLGIGIRLLMLLHERRLRQDNIRLERAVREKTARIQEELNTRNQFFSVISHDLRSPIYGIQRLSAELAEKTEAIGPEGMKDGLMQLKDAATGTSELLENLLLWSLGQRGVLEPVIRKENLSVIIERAISAVIEQAATKKVRVETSVDPDLTIDTDRNMLTTCVRNLLDNAVRFSPHGGTIILKVTRTGHTVVISIRDHGPGMNETILKTLSKPGRLGLVITRDLLDKIGGTLHARNATGGGCETTIELDEYDKKTENTAY